MPTVSATALCFVEPHQRVKDRREFSDKANNTRRADSPVLAQTPRMVECADESGQWLGRCRGDEITAWLAKHGDGVESFVILDDAEDMGAQRAFLLQTEYDKGLIDEIAEEAVRRLTERVPTVPAT